MKILSLPLALSAILALGACSATNGGARTRPADRSASPGKIASVRTFKTTDTLYVAGTLRRPAGHSIPQGAHIDIVLIDRAGRVIAAKQDRIAPVHPRQERRRGGQYSFSIGFPLATGRDAERIRVSYHPETHS
jgi:hypothetical protein